MNNVILGFIFIITITWSLAMVMGTIEIDDEKNAGELLAILITVPMRQYDAEGIARWSTSRASLKATSCEPSGGLWLWLCVGTHSENYFDIGIIAVTISRAGPATAVLPFFLLLFSGCREFFGT